MLEIPTPTTIILNKPIEDLPEFAKKTFTPDNKLNIVGGYVSLANDFVKVAAVDLLTRQKVNFEINNNWIRIYTSDKEPEPTIQRFLEYIHNHYDSDAKKKT